MLVGALEGKEGGLFWAERDRRAFSGKMIVDSIMYYCMF